MPTPLQDWKHFEQLYEQLLQLKPLWAGWDAFKVWTTKARPLIQKCFGKHLPHFDEVTAEPTWYVVDFGKENDYIGMQTLKGARIGNNGKAKDARKRLVAFMRSLRQESHQAERSMPRSTRAKSKGKSMAKIKGKIFIGHGRSSAWRDLKDFIQDRLKLEWDEFNREPAAGLTTQERLERMLSDACFAFIVMTAEDERADGKKHARENVIHETGLFQARLGFKRAIVLLEEGCEEFSNITGLTQIRFPGGRIMDKSEEIRRVLERERIYLT